MKNSQLLSLFLITIMFIFYVNSTKTKLRNKTTLQTQCHPQCSWKCDDPHCPAICDPVCEPPKCHTACQEPHNAICDVKCEKPECEIKCPDKGCEGLDCPKCVTVCKQPHCVTHCQAPKPQCEAVCEEPKCDWKCRKPECPKPKCELVCENPNCAPKVECCDCEGKEPLLSEPFPFFKDTEQNKNCCPCTKDSSNYSFRQKDQGESWTGVDGEHTVQKEKIEINNIYDEPITIGKAFYEKPKELMEKAEKKAIEETMKLLNGTKQ